MSQDLPPEILCQIALEATLGEDFVNWLLSCEHMRELLTREIGKMILKLVEVKRKMLKNLLREKILEKYMTNISKNNFNHKTYSRIYAYSNIEGAFKFIFVRGCKQYINCTCMHTKNKNMYFSVLDHCFGTNSGEKEGCEISCGQCGSTYTLSSTELNIAEKLFAKNE